jgi:hypothetical protein
MKIMVSLALVAGLIGGGAWNYQRNAHLAEEAKAPRPYKSYSMEQLDQLLQAYTQEKAQFQSSLGKLEVKGEDGPAYAPSDLKGKLNGFERAQKNAARYNDVHSAMLDREVEIDRIQKERALRQAGGGDDSPWSLTYRRITTF